MSYTHIIKDTGIKVHISKVSPLLLQELDTQYPAPKPPLNEVDYGDGVKVFEENPNDPDYKAALQEHNIKQEHRVRRLILRFGVKYELTAEDIARVKELREFWKSEYDKTLEGTDTEVFLSYLALGSGEDLNELIVAVISRSQPTEENIDAAVDRFQPDLQTPPVDENKNASQRDGVSPRRRVAASR